jgi:hypothetical protein
VSGVTPQDPSPAAAVPPAATPATAPQGGAAGEVILTADQAAIAVAALGDAVTYRLERAAAWCEACKSHPAGACEQHLDDLDMAAMFRETATQIMNGAK